MSRFFDEETTVRYENGCISDTDYTFDGITFKLDNHSTYDDGSPKIKIGDFVFIDGKQDGMDDYYDLDGLDGQFFALCINQRWGYTFIGSPNDATSKCFGLEGLNFFKVKPKSDVELWKYFLEKNQFYGHAYRRIIEFLTINCNWGYTDDDGEFKSYYQMIRTPVCPICGEPIGENFDNSQLRHSKDNKLMCYGCFIKKFSCCSRCGDYYDKDGDDLCPKCRKRNFVLPYHRFAPPLDFSGSTHNNSMPYLGVELEVDEGGESNSSVANVMSIMNPRDKMFVYCMHDGSLSDGFEIITQPATLEYHTSIKGMYAKMFDWLLSKGYLSHDTSTCGIHVHFNRDFYKDNEELYITRLLYLVDKFWDDIVKFSRRNQRRIDRYSKKVDMPIKEYIHRSNKSNEHDYHYYAINLANENTIEFRMFKGSLNIETFFSILQFVNSCVICAKVKTAEEIQHMEFEDLIVGKDCRKYWDRRKGLNNTEE